MSNTIRNEVEQAAQALFALSDRLADADTDTEVALAMHEIADIEGGVIGALYELLQSAQGGCVSGNRAWQEAGRVRKLVAALEGEFNEVGVAFADGGFDPYDRPRTT
ncbi:hypothetical protein [Streptacidiphilus sp. MAP5-52]|uniref:hypothetical protein n=1 Tax=Streptacidiphilus sp. MAP5-52 TaxID=3156267 RepID=UPI00351817C9